MVFAVLALCFLVFKYLPYMPFALFLAAVPVVLYAVGTAVVGRDAVIPANGALDALGGSPSTHAPDGQDDGEKRQLRSVATGTRRQIVLWNVGLVLFIGGVFSVAGWVVYDASLDHGQLTDVGLRDSIIAELSNDDATLDPCISHDPKLVFHHTLIRLNATLSVLDATESMRRTDFDATESCSAAFLLVSSALITGCVSVCFGLGCLLGAVWLNNRQSKIAQVATVLQWLVLLVLVGMWGGALIFFSSLRVVHLVKNVTAALAGTCIILMGAMMGPSALLNSVRSQGRHEYVLSIKSL